MTSLVCTAALVLTVKAPAERGTEKAARALVEAFVKPDANVAELTRKLRPTRADYAAVFEGGAAAKAEAAYGPDWDSGSVVIEGKPEQTDVILAHATTEELRAWTGGASEFPGGYRKAAPFLKPGLTFWRFKFVKPGETSGMAYDGLVWVNGHFTIFPKPWRVLNYQPTTPRSKPA
jgi:hypothetical protein